MGEQAPDGQLAVEEGKDQVLDQRSTFASRVSADGSRENEYHEGNVEGNVKR